MWYRHCTTITNLRFANDIDGLAGDEEELAKLVECLDQASTGHCMDNSAEKTNLMTNTSGINKKSKVNRQKLETVPSFKYLGSDVSDEGSKPEIVSRIAQTTAALTRLKPVWNDRSISLSSKIRLMRFIVTPMFLFARENEVLPQDTKYLIQKPCYQRGSLCQDPAGNRTTRRI